MRPRKKSFSYLIFYFSLEMVSRALAIFPFSWIQFLGRMVGLLIFHILPIRRKIALNNLAKARTLALSEKEIYTIARDSFKLVFQVFVESFALYSKSPKFIRKIFKLHTETPLVKGAKIFLLPHKGSWEGSSLLASLDGFCCHAIARAFPQEALQDWITKKRERFNAKIIMKHEGPKQFFKVLREGHSLGILADQAHLHSSYDRLFLGSKAYTPTTPAALARKMNIPIYCVDVTWQSKHWLVAMSKPIYPNPNLPKLEDVDRMTEETLRNQESVIQKNPKEWLWFHRRWKRKAHSALPKLLKADTLVCILPDSAEALEKLCLKDIEEVFFDIPITFFVQEKLKNKLQLSSQDIQSYGSLEEIKPCYGYDLLINLTENHKLSLPWLKKGVIKNIELTELKKIAKTAKEWLKLETFSSYPK